MYLLGSKLDFFPQHCSCLSGYMYLAGVSSDSVELAAWCCPSAADCAQVEGLWAEFLLATQPPG